MDARSIPDAITTLAIRGARISAAILFATACTGKDSTPTTPAVVASVSLDRTTLSVEQSKSATLVASPRDATGAALTGRTVSWSSDASNIASVSQSGAVTGVAVGTTTIRATSEGKAASAQVTVTPIAVASVTLDRTTVSLEQATTTTLVATLRDAAGTTITGRQVTWASNANDVAAVTQAGLVTAVAVGVANITATREGKTATAQITVTPIPVATVTLSQTVLDLTVGEVATLTAETRSAAAQLLTGRNVAWTAADATVVSVANGAVTAIAPGNTTIAATSEGKVATATVLVRPQSCASTVATGRLSGASPNAFAYTTLQGWTVTITRLSMKVQSPNPAQTMFYEYWASTHENVGGKHVKDLFGDRRTILLPGGVTITAHTIPRPGDMVQDYPMDWVQWISIYEGNESHRIDMQAFAITQSCALPMFGEAAEHDGEAASIYFNEIGMRMDNVYQQDASPSGVPLQKVFNTVPIAQTVFNSPNQVNDFFDDPRLGHTWY